MELSPALISTTIPDGTAVFVANPFYAPLEVELQTDQLDNASRRKVIAPRSKQKAFVIKGILKSESYRWTLGDPTAKPTEQLYNLPVPTKTCHAISQGFNGRFTHHDDYNQYAVDIVLPVGTPIQAAREGTVVMVKDDYHMGGVNDYFLDKANYVRVLHADGTFAVYLHILLGSAVVKLGDHVEKGTVLARSGSSGFSSGPHLHFVIVKNAGMGTKSIPFNFIDSTGQPFVPTEGKTICN